MSRFEAKIAEFRIDGLFCANIETIQVNLGFRCNQMCVHCHVQASPSRDEVMNTRTMEMVLAAAERAQPRLVDLTGGAPEMNPHFRWFVQALRQAGHCVQVRTNLTVLLERGKDDLPEFLREHEVHLVASLPCYLEQNVRAQRGPGVYQKSIEAIRRLNRLGYGVSGGLPLNLVYNPGGPFLPPDQQALEADYKRQLGEQFGVEFSRLLTITNMPLGRFLADLRREKQEEHYCHLLEEAFNPETLDGLMCRHQVSVGWDGTLYDCDFNLALGLPVRCDAANHIGTFDLEALTGRKILTGEHCFGCTAGCGSSCAGALA